MSEEYTVGTETEAKGHEKVSIFVSPRLIVKLEQIELIRKEIQDVKQ